MVALEAHPLARIIQGLNHEIREIHESLRDASQVTRGIVSLRPRAAAATNLPHRFAFVYFVYFVYFVVNNPDL